tara:strand:- start:557 stop:670 length:114 start_codon:yes stop_codon:yes gene_type:complete
MVEEIEALEKRFKQIIGEFLEIQFELRQLRLRVENNG